MTNGLDFAAFSAEIESLLAKLETHPHPLEQLHQADWIEVRDKKIQLTEKGQKAVKGPPTSPTVKLLIQQAFEGFIFIPDTKLLEELVACMEIATEFAREFQAGKTAGIFVEAGTWAQAIAIKQEAEAHSLIAFCCGQWIMQPF